MLSDATISLPRYHRFLGVTLRTLSRLPDAAGTETIDRLVLDAVGATAEQVKVVSEKTGVPVLLDRLHWARMALKTAGLVEEPSQGRWRLTDGGRSSISASDDQIRTFVEQEKQRRARPAPAEPSVQAGDGWTRALLARLLELDPSAFERLCKIVLEKCGFTEVEVTGRTGDCGIDGIGVVPINLLSFHVLFQCKRYTGSVGSPEVRNFRGAMQGRADKGLIITTGTFTAEARREATRDSVRAIDLIDGEKLCLLMKTHSLGVTTRVIEQVSLDRGFFRGI